MQIKRIESVVEKRTKRFLHVTLSPFRAVKAVSKLAPAIVEIQIKQGSRADDLVISAASYTPFQSCLTPKAIMDFIYQL